MHAPPVRLGHGDPPRRVPASLRQLLLAGTSLLALGAPGPAASSSVELPADSWWEIVPLQPTAAEQLPVLLPGAYAPMLQAAPPPITGGLTVTVD